MFMLVTFGIKIRKTMLIKHGSSVSLTNIPFYFFPYQFPEAKNKVKLNHRKKGICIILLGIEDRIN